MNTKIRYILHFPQYEPFQDNWFSITYTQSATTRYFSCQVYIQILVISWDWVEVKVKTKPKSVIAEPT